MGYRCYDTGGSDDVISPHSADSALDSAEFSVQLHLLIDQFIHITKIWP